MGEDLQGDVGAGWASSEDPGVARLAAAFAAADVHPLLCAVAHRTGDLGLLRADFAPDQSQMLVPGRGLGPEQEAAARRLAAEAWRAHDAVGRGRSRPVTR